MRTMAHEHADASTNVATMAGLAPQHASNLGKTQEIHGVFWKNGPDYYLEWSRGCSELVMFFKLVRELMTNFMLCFGELLKIGFRMIGFILCFGGNEEN